MAIKDYIKYWSSSGSTQGITNQLMQDKGYSNLRALNDMNSPNYVGQSYFDLIKDNNPLSPNQGLIGGSGVSVWLIVGFIVLIMIILVKD